MKKILFFIPAAALIVTSCSKKSEETLNASSQKSFSAWIQKYYPDVKKSGHGVYILNEVSGKTPLGDADEYPYVRMDYVVADLSGNISDYSEKSTAQHLGEYLETTVYVPKVFYRGEGGMNMGLIDAIEGMSIGGERLVAVPGWLNSPVEYDTEEEYLQNVSGVNGQYVLKLREQIKDITEWELDSLCTVIKRRHGIERKDSLKYGFYYKRTGEPESETEFPADTTIQINYIGRLIDGRVFDTTIKDTAIFYGLYSSSSTYGSTSFTVASNYTESTLNSSTVIDGFAYMISKMHPGESGSSFFISDLGYGTSGSGTSIPPYSPLQFDVEIVKE